jgi:virginiamycin B lyase
MESLARNTLTLLLAAVTLAACGDSQPAESDTGAVVAEVKLAPTDARCIQLKSVGATTVTQSFDVAPTSTTVLTMKNLPVGAVSITASAYNVACASVVAGTTVAVYISDPVMVNVTLNGPVGATFVMRPNLTAGTGPATIEFPSTAQVTETLLTATASPAGIALGPDGALWIAERGANKIARLPPGGPVTEFALPAGASTPIDLVAGPDGNLWFAENFTGGKIGRITPSGVVSEFLLTATSLPRDLAVGSDGAIWFLDGTAKIARITTWGAVTSWAAPSAAINDLAACPDGNIWFAASEPDLVGRITPAGVITTWAQTWDGGSITCTPDGKVWVVEGASGMVAQGTTSGFASGVTHINTGVPSITDLTPGPDGAAWFIGYTGVVGRVSPFAAWPTPRANSVPGSMTVGADGALYFVMANGTVSSVGRLLP